jgi:hypothetical protein
MGIFCKVCETETIYDTSRAFLGNHVIKEHKISIQEYYDKYFKKEKEGICESCGQPTKFIKFSQGYRRFCSTRCSTSADTTLDKAKKTYYEKTGYEHNMRNPNHLDIRKKSNLETYGVEWTTQLKEQVIKSEATKLKRYGSESYNNREKSRLTCLEKYNVDNVSKLDSIKEKISIMSKQNSASSLEKSRNTNLLKYGVDSPYKLEKTKINKRNSIIDSFKEFLSNNYPGYSLISYNTDSTVTLKCPRDHEFTIQLQYLRIRMERKEEICKTCNPIKNNGFSRSENLN